MTRPEQLEKERLDNINTFIFFTTNFPDNFVVSIWPGNNHIKQKFNNVYEKYGASAAVNRFYFELDSNNRKLLLNWINDNYKKQELHT